MKKIFIGIFWLILIIAFIFGSWFSYKKYGPEMESASGKSASVVGSGIGQWESVVSIDEKKEVEVLFFQIAPFYIDCVGGNMERCLVVDGKYFYEQILGFGFEEGYIYKISAKEINTVSHKYEIIEILSKIASDRKAEDYLL